MEKKYIYAYKKNTEKLFESLFEIYTVILFKYFNLDTGFNSSLFDLFYQNTLF